MSVTFSVAIKNSRVDTLVDLVDAGSTNLTGRLRLKDSSSNVLSEHAMSDPAFGAAASGSATADTISDATAALTGSAVSFDVIDRDEDVVFSGTVTATGGGGDLESSTSSTLITAGGTVSVSSLIYVEGG